MKRIKLKKKHDGRKPRAGVDSTGDRRFRRQLAPAKRAARAGHFRVRRGHTDTLFFYLPLILWFTGLTAVLDCYYKTRARAPRNKKKERPPTRGKTPFFCYVVYFYFFPLRVPNYRQVNGGKWALAAISAAGSPSLPARFLLFRHLVLLVRVELVSVEYPDPLACVSSATARRRKKKGKRDSLSFFFVFFFAVQFREEKGLASAVRNGVAAGDQPVYGFT